ncbi:MAG: PilZ domain-containing protein, partial [Planctomycetia bacterium]
MQTLIDTDEALTCCIEEAAAEASADQRMQQRYPFFHPIKVSKKDAPEYYMSAFSRDISPGGIGLFHNMPLNTGQVTLHIPLASDRVLDIDTDIKWCTPAGDGWYFSGGNFLGLSTAQIGLLLIDVIKGDATRRLQQRYPYYRPMTLTIGGDEETVRSVFGRDISESG